MNWVVADSENFLSKILYIKNIKDVTLNTACEIYDINMARVRHTLKLTGRLSSLNMHTNSSKIRLEFNIGRVFFTEDRQLVREIKIRCPVWWLGPGLWSKGGKNSPSSFQYGSPNS